MSSTKEYLVEEEEKLKSTGLIRCLVYENDVAAEEDKENEQENDIKIKVNEEAASFPAVDSIKIEIQEQIRDTSMMDHNYDENPQQPDITTSDDSIQSVEAKLVFRDKNELMDYITKNLSVDELFDKLTQAEEESLKRKELIKKVVKTVGFNDLFTEYFSTTETSAAKLSNEQSALISGILSEISTLMQNNRNVKHKVLDVLSEKHSEEFLGHALQENSTSRVCDKITIPSIVNYLIHKVNVLETDENDALINRMNRSMLHNLINKTHDGSNELVADPKETQELMRLLFKNKPKIEVFDIVHEFLRNLVQNH